MLDQMANEIKLLSGSSHPELSAQVASRYVVRRFVLLARRICCPSYVSWVSCDG
jgi:hypothetical protein